MFDFGVAVVCLLVIIATLILMQNYQGPDERLKKIKVYKNK
jgi:hypothetical protein